MNETPKELDTAVKVILDYKPQRAKPGKRPSEEQTRQDIQYLAIC